MSPQEIQAACEATLDPSAREALHALTRRVLSLEAGYHMLAQRARPAAVPVPPPALVPPPEPFGSIPMDVPDTQWGI